MPQHKGKPSVYLEHGSLILQRLGCTKNPVFSLSDEIHPPAVVYGLTHKLDSQVDIKESRQASADARCISRHSRWTQ